MHIKEIDIESKGLKWILRNAVVSDAEVLSVLRVKLDAETEFMDREEGEGVRTVDDFIHIIEDDLTEERSLFIVAEVDNEIVGYARCIGKKLNRFKHQAEFGICISKKYWGFGIGPRLLQRIVEWADNIGLEKIILSVVENNDKAVELYKKFGFEIEGRLIKDRCHRDGKYYNTLLMGRFNNEVSND